MGLTTLFILPNFLGLSDANKSIDASSEPTCYEEAIDYAETEDSTSYLADGESVIIQEGRDGSERVCRDENDSVVTDEVLLEPADKLVLHGTGDLPDGYDGYYNELDVVEDYFNNGMLTRPYFGTYTYQQPVNVGYRTGAMCWDGTYSSATGSGACSWHGGVAEWLYE